MKLPMLAKDSPASIVFGIASIVGLIFTLIYTSISLYKNDYSVDHVAVILTLAVVNALLGFFLYIQSSNHYSLVADKHESTLDGFKYRQLIKEYRATIADLNSINAEISFIFHNINDQLRDNTYNLMQLHDSLLFDKTKNAEESDVVDVLRITKSFNLYVVDNIKDLFDKLTNSNTSVCIKFLNGFVDDNDPLISTLMRDTRSYRIRKSSEAVFSKNFLWHENSAFKDILSINNSAKYFASDDLANEKGYVNCNANWEDQYNSTIVCPIRYGAVDSGVNGLDMGVIGFICVDNFEGKLDQAVCIDALAAIADSLYLYFIFNNKIFDLVESRSISANP